MREALWLVKNGVPFDVAFSVDDVTRAAWAIILSEHEGATFNWATMDWDKQG